jgi:hypothetical protein
MQKNIVETCLPQGSAGVRTVLRLLPYSSKKECERKSQPLPSLGCLRADFDRHLAEA